MECVASSHWLCHILSHRLIGGTMQTSQLNPQPDLYLQDILMKSKTEQCAPQHLRDYVLFLICQFVHVFCLQDFSKTNRQIHFNFPHKFWFIQLSFMWPYFLKMSPHINIAVGDSYIESVSAVRNLGAFFDEHMSMDTFVHKKCATKQCQLRKLYRIRKYLTFEARKSLKQAFVISRLDYCCSLLLGTKKANIDHLQCLQNSAARFIFGIPPHESAKPYIQLLHWLSV